MSTYKNLIGKDVNFLTTDPDNDAAEGQIWYNSTSGVFKNVIVGQAWSSGGPVNNARRGGAASGTLTAGLAFGGRIPPGTNVADTEEYNGTGWAAGGNLGTARYNLASAQNAPQTASLAFGSATSPDTTTEEYNGSSWTAGGALNTGRGFLGGAGIQTAALGFGGYAGGNVNNVEEYDGSSWTAANVFPSSTRQMGGNGLQTAALSTGGTTTGPSISTTVEYDGTNWTSGGAYPQTIIDVRLAGIQTDTLAFGGSPPPSKTTLTTNYDGTSWTVNPASMATPRTAHFGGGTSSAAFAASGLTGGPPPSSTPFSEEYNRSINVITAGAFSSMSNLNTARWGLGGAGTKAAAIVFGGRNPPVGQDLALTEEFSGTSWSEGPDLNTATRVCGRGTGTSTAALKHGGHSGSPSSPNKTAEEYDGSSWANGGASTNNHDGTMQIGTQTAAASCGSNPPTGAKTEEYNGTSWTASNDMPYSGYLGSASGTQTAGVVFGGYPNQNNSAEYDGTNWTAGNTLLQPTAAQGGNGGSGTQTLAIGAGGYTPGPIYLTAAFTYDGTNFATAPSMATARQEVGAQGANTSLYVAGGLLAPGTASNAAEEFTAESSALNIKTITTS